MNYIHQINAFWERISKGEQLSTTSVALYFTLLHLNNLSGWRRPMRVYPREVMELTGIGSSKTYHYHLSILKDRGFIDYEPGKNQYQATQVLLLCFSPVGQVPVQKIPGQSNGKERTEERQPLGTPSFTGLTEDAKHINKETIKHKTKDEGGFWELKVKIREDYEAFVKKRTGFPARINEVDAQGLENITAYLLAGNKGNPVTVWQKLLSGWDKLNSFYQSKISLEQIDKNFLSMLTQIEKSYENDRKHYTEGTEGERSHSERKDFGF